MGEKKEGQRGGWGIGNIAVLLLSGGYHGDGGTTERDGRDWKHTHAHTKCKLTFLPTD